MNAPCQLTPEAQIRSSCLLKGGGTSKYIFKIIAKIKLAMLESDYASHHNKSVSS